MKKYQCKLNCRININPTFFVDVDKELEIAFPCINCHRFRRTIIFRGVNKEGICTPINKCDGFFGKLISCNIIKKLDFVEIEYLIVFFYEPFIDIKYDIESDLDFESGWARISFNIKCPKCQIEKISTQGNIVRPLNRKCKCGNIIYNEEKDPFNFKITEIK